MKKINMKSLIITSIVCLLPIICGLMFYNELPESIAIHWGIDNNPNGYFSKPAFVFVLLITGIYSGILGSNILLKEESDKTIEYLNSVPVTRKNIVLNKILCGLLYIILMVAIIGIFNFIGLSLSGEFDRKSYILLSITPIFSSIVIFAVCLFFSSFTHKTKKTLGISLGIVFASYFLNIISEMGESTELLKYISIFTLADIRNVIINESINPLMIVLTIGITVIFMILTTICYEKKELV